MNLGWRRDIPDHRDFKYCAHPEMVQAPALPKSVDLSPVFPPIKDQLDINSCVGNGVGECLEFVQMKGIRDKKSEPEIFQPNAYIPLSRLFIYYNARLIDGDSSYDCGTQIRSAILGVRNRGIVEEMKWPYLKSNVLKAPSSNVYTEAQGHKVLAGYRVDQSNIDEIKSCLVLGYPIAGGFSLYESFRMIKSNGLVPMPKEGEGLLGGHCMAVVGYDEESQHFKIANSWGTVFGDKGYCYLPYEYILKGLCADFWTLREE